MPSPRDMFRRISKWLGEMYSLAHERLGRRCQYCHWRRAVWFYAPGLAIACDECVPRGCSCNQNEDGTYELDERGRKQPCCEWWMFSD